MFFLKKTIGYPCNDKYCSGKLYGIGHLYGKFLVFVTKCVPFYSAIILRFKKISVKSSGYQFMPRASGNGGFIGWGLYRNFPYNILLAAQGHMSLEQEIEKEFELLPKDLVTDAFIEENYNLMEIVSDIDDSRYIPNYILWCIKQKQDNGSLVFDYTINALAEYSRMKNPNTFKHQCNETQKKIICQFLEWCLNNVITGSKNQIERALVNWA